MNVPFYYLVLEQIDGNYQNSMHNSFESATQHIRKNAMKFRPLYSIATNSRHNDFYAIGRILT